jgi:hypothetical protein
MIRFGCPRCNSVLNAADEKVGWKFPCPRCGQRLQVPPPLPHPTVDSTYPPGSVDDPTGNTNSSPVSVPKNGTSPYHVRKPVVLATVFGVGIVLFGSALVFMHYRSAFDDNGANDKAHSSFKATQGAATRPPPPSEQTDGTAWSHRELVQYLRQCGLRFDTHPIKATRPAMTFDFTTATEGNDSDVMTAWRDSAWRELNADELPVIKEEVLVMILGSATEAKDKAGLWGDRGFAWGRFAFRGKPDHLRRIKEALRLPAAHP